jgi:hypothetical protein
MTSQTEKKSEEKNFRLSELLMYKLVVKYTPEVLLPSQNTLNGHMQIRLLLCIT